MYAMQLVASGIQSATLNERCAFDEKVSGGKGCITSISLEYECLKMSAHEQKKPNRRHLIRAAPELANLDVLFPPGINIVETFG